MESGTQIGVYKILTMLGAGGMARVYLAQDSRLGRKVALKVLPADSVQNPERVRRFEQEARAASALNHPNILTIYDIGDVDSTKFIATEFVEGSTVREMLYGPLPLLKVLDIGLQAAAALATAHAAGIVHRDIKPENIMVRPDGFVKVLDFGLAKLTQTSPDSIYGEQTIDVTMPGVVMGTLGYMSPEQLRGHDVDQRTDVFSLGAVLYEMVTGNAPFAAPTPTDTMVAVLQRDPPPARNLRVEAPEELERILSKALAKERDERYQSIKDLAIDLKRLKQRMEAEAERHRSGDVPQSASYVPAAPKRLARGRIALITAGAIIAVAILGFALWRQGQPSSSIGPSTQAAKQGDKGESQQPETAPQPPRVPAPAASAREKGKEAAANPSGAVIPGVVVPNIAVNLPPNLGELGPRKGERQLTFSLMVQPMQNGKPIGQLFRSFGQDPLRSGWKFSFNMASPESGRLYLIDEPESGAPAILFPTEKVNQGNATIVAKKPLQIGPYTLDANPGREKLWIVWSSTPVFELQLAFNLMKNPNVASYASSSSITPQIRSFLGKYKDHASQADAQPYGGEMKLTSHVDPLVYAVELEHR